jgi:hypothetical protein
MPTDELTEAEKILQKNYNLKKSGEPFVEGRQYYFLTRDKLHVKKGKCLLLGESDCKFHMMGDPDYSSTNKPNDMEAYWRHGNPLGLGTVSDFMHNEKYDGPAGGTRRRRRRNKKSTKTRRYRRRK